MSYKINDNDELTEKYLDRLKARIFKILPLIEEDNKGVFMYVDSLLFELYGLQHVVRNMVNSQEYVSLLCTLESLQDEIIVKEKDFRFIRSEILRLVGTVDKLQKKEG